MQSGAENGMFVVSEIRIHIFLGTTNFWATWRRQTKEMDPRQIWWKAYIFTNNILPRVVTTFFSVIQQFRKMKKRIPDPNVLQKPEKESKQK